MIFGVLSTNRLYALTIQCMAEEIQKGRAGEYYTLTYIVCHAGGGEKEPMNKLYTIKGFLLRCIILLQQVFHHLHPRQ